MGAFATKLALRSAWATGGDEDPRAEDPLPQTRRAVLAPARRTRRVGLLGLKRDPRVTNLGRWSGQRPCAQPAGGAQVLAPT